MQFPMLTIAVRAARKAGHLIVKYYEMFETVDITKIYNSDFVTEVDKEAEATIIQIIRRSYPKHSIFSESGGLQVGLDQEVQWIIDPLDGSTNFLKHLPHFSVSIAIRIKGRTEVGVIYDPMRNELFTATRGQGAQLNGHRLRGSSARNLEETILVTCFPLKEVQYAITYTNILAKLFNACMDFRLTGSSALDLAYLAAGRFDGYFEIALKPWDFAAGELIAREAGMLVCDFRGGHNYVITGNLVAGNARILKAILVNIRDELTDVFQD